MSSANKRRDWSLVSSHGSLLFFVACNPGSTIEEIAAGLSVTTRTAWALVGDLRRAGMLSVQRVGRRNSYGVKPDAPFLHPTIQGIPLRAVLGVLMDATARAEPIAPETGLAVLPSAAPRRPFSRVG